LEWLSIYPRTLMANGFSFEEASTPLAPVAATPPAGFSFEEAMAPAAVPAAPAKREETFSFEDAAKPSSEFAPIEEAKKGFTGSVKQMVEGLPLQLGLQRDVSSIDFNKTALGTYEAIDRGEVTTPAEARQKGYNLQSASTYLRATPEARAQMKQNRFEDTSSRAETIRFGIEKYKQFQKENEQYRGRTPEALDIRGITDFSNWLAYNVGAGGPQIAAVMLGGTVGNLPGALGVGTTLAYGETLGNRLEYIMERTKGLPPKEQADKIADYIRSSGDVNMAVAVGSGALDMFGPVGTLLRKQFAKEAGKAAIKYETKREAATAALKKTPRELAEEGLTGGAQEATQIAGEFALGEQVGEVLSNKNLKRVFNAAASEAAGSLTGSGVNVSTAVGQKALQDYTEQLVKREVERQVREVETQKNVAGAAPQFDAIVERLVSDGMDEVEAFKTAGSILASGGIESELGQSVTGGSQPSVSVAGGEGAPAQAAGVLTTTTPEGLGLLSTSTDVAGAGTTRLVDTLAPFETEIRQTYEPNEADQILARANELVLDGAQPQIAIDTAVGEVFEEVEDTGTPAGKPFTFEEGSATPATGIAATAATTATTATPTEVVTPTTETQAPAGEKPKGRRGRKKIVRTPEEQALYEATRDYNAGVIRDTGRRVEKINKQLLEEPNPNDYDTVEGLQLAINEKERQNELLRAELYAIGANPANRNNKPGKTARAAVDAMTEGQRNAAKRAFEASKQDVARSEKGTTASTDPNPELAKFTTAVEALEHIATTGNVFERLLARRLKKFVRGTKLVIVYDPEFEIPNDSLREQFEDAGGMYSPSNDTIYLDATEGLDNVTLLHEALHGATLNKIRAWMANPKSVDEATRKAIEELKRIMDSARNFYTVLSGFGKSSPALDQLLQAGAFTDLAEFVSYGLTLPVMQNFLQNVSGRFSAAEARKGGMWSKFSDAVRKMFNMGDNQSNAFLDLITVTDQIMEAPRIAATANQEAAFAKKANKVDRLQNKIDRSSKGSLLNASIGQLMAQTRNSKDALRLLKAVYGALNVGTLRKILPTLTTEDITRWIGDKIVNIKYVNDYVQEMAAMRTRMINDIAKFVPEWVSFAQKHEMTGRYLGDVMHATTLLEVDPTKYPDVTTALANDAELKAREARYNDPAVTGRSKIAAKGRVTERQNQIKRAYSMWSQLGAMKGGTQAQSIYKAVKQKYQDTFDLHERLLLAKIAASSVPGDIKDASTPKGKLIASITQTFQEARKLEAYFPLMRYGNHWFRLGKGKAGEFYMFESAAARNNAVAARVEELQKAGDKRSLEKMIEDGDIDVGDDLRQMRTQVVESSQMLKGIFEMLDKNKLTDLEAVKDQIYQMYLMTLPEKDIRRKFTHRQGKTGFSADVIRNFIVSQHTAANQLSRLEYSDRIRNALGSAYAELAGNPDKLKLNAFVDEIAMRVGSEMTPRTTDGLDWDRLASVGNQLVFYYLLTAPKSALVQMTQLPLIGLPTLVAEYGGVDTARVSGRYSMLFRTMGLTKRDAAGNVTTNWGQPSINDSSYVNSHPDLSYRKMLKRAWKYADDRDLFMSTYASDMTSRAKAPTATYQGTTRKTLRFVGNFMSGAFHHLERISRETMYMSTFELEYARQKKANKSDIEAFQAAVKKAMDITYDSLFNYTQYNKPRVMKSPVGKIATQFLSYPLQVTSYLVRNFYGMLPYLNKEEKRECAIKFFGTIGMTAAFAGVTGLPLYSLIMGLSEGIRDLLRGEDEEDYDEDDEGNPLGKRNLDIWFREWFIPHYFGAGSSLAGALGLTEEQANTLQRSVELGPISALTDLNIGASTSLDGLWFRDDTPADDAKGAFQEMLINTFGGPLASAGSQVASALDDFNSGHFNRGLEKILPAFLRGSAVAYRLNAEGLKTKQGVEIKPAEYYTTGKLLAQALGFQSTEVAEIQKFNFKAKQMVTEIEKDRSRLLNKLDLAVQRYDEDDSDANEAKIDKLLEEIDKFNVKNGSVNPITGDTVNKSLSNRAKRRAEAFEGLSVSKREAPFVYPLSDRFRRE